MAAGNQWKHLEFTLALSKHLFSLLIQRTFPQHIGYSELEIIWRIDIFVHVTCYRETMPMSRIVKKPCSIFKTKRSTDLKTGQQSSIGGRRSRTDADSV